jgi:hypothetical protein
LWAVLELHGWSVGFFSSSFLVLSLGEVYIVIQSSLLAAGMVLSVELYHFWPDFCICGCGFLSYYHGLLWSLLCLQGVLSCGLFLFFVKTLWVFILVASSICSTGALKIVVTENLTGDLIGWDSGRSYLWENLQRFQLGESYIWGRIIIVRSWELVVVATLNLLGNWQSYGRTKL